MNALGLTYGSSSDDDDNSDNELQQPALTPSAVSVLAPTPTTAASAATTPSEEHDELETMLERAGIPPEPAGVHADPDVQTRIRELIAAHEQHEQQQGDCSKATARVESSFQASLRAKKDVRNPYILAKVVAHFGIDEYQTNLDPRVFDPRALPLHEFSDALALAQKRQSDAREQRQLQMQMQGDVRQLQFTRGATSERL